MEEVGKYQSLQDRIKRLTKNKNQKVNTDFITSDKQAQAICLNDLSNLKNGDQTENRTSFRKNRNMSISNQKQFMLSKTDQFSLIRRSEDYSSQLNKNKLLSNVGNNITNQYILSKPYRQEKQNFKNLLNLTSIQNKDSSCLNDSKYLNKLVFNREQTQNNQTGQKSFVRSNNAQGFTKRKAFGHSYNKSVSNLTYRENYQLLAKYGVPIKDKQEKNGKMSTLNQRIKTHSDQDAGIMRCLKKCRSGMIERIPGKIVKNK